jgi:hypothetical protein
MTERSLQVPIRKAARLRRTYIWRTQPVKRAPRQSRRQTVCLLSTTEPTVAPSALR